MKKLIESWNRHLNEFGSEEEEDNPESSVELGTADGRKVGVAIKRLNSPKEFIDFLKLLAAVITQPDINEKIKILAVKAGWDNDDIVAIKRLANALKSEEQ